MGIVWLWDNKNIEFPGERLDSKTFKSMKSELFEHVKNQDMCRSRIGPSYLKNAILKGKYILISKTENSITGFAVLEFKESSLYISLICSGEKGVGTRMMDAVFEYALTNKNIEYITLDSVSEAYEFYLKKGFKLYCPEGSICPMYKKNTLKNKWSLFRK